SRGGVSRIWSQQQSDAQLQRSCARTRRRTSGCCGVLCASSRQPARTSGDKAPIGPYVVDFRCPAGRLIIELYGGHHTDDEIAKRDRERQLWLENEGYRVVRFWNSEITEDLRAVLERIYVELYGSRDAEMALMKHRRRG